MFATANRVKENIRAGVLTGLLSPVELTALKAKAAAGFPPDPRIAQTEQMRADLTALAGSRRLAIIGPGSVSEYEQKLLERAAAGNITFDEKTIREVTAVSERLALKSLINHQQKLEQFAKENPALAETVYARYSRPMEEIVPSDHPAVRRLLSNLDNPRAIQDFDQKFHTPGLALKLIERERGR